MSKANSQPSIGAAIVRLLARHAEQRFTAFEIAVGTGHSLPAVLRSVEYLVSEDQINRDETAEQWRSKPRTFFISRERADVLVKRAERKCLCCGSVFESEGPHNRLCDRCRRLSATTTPFDL